MYVYVYVYIYIYIYIYTQGSSATPGPWTEAGPPCADVEQHAARNKAIYIYIYICIYIYIYSYHSLLLACVCVYIYIYRERERERHRDERAQTLKLICRRTDALRESDPRHAKCTPLINARSDGRFSNYIWVVNLVKNMPPGQKTREPDNDRSTSL